MIKIITNWTLALVCGNPKGGTWGLELYLEVRCTYNLLSNCSSNPVIPRLSVVMGLKSWLVSRYGISITDLQVGELMVRHLCRFLRGRRSLRCLMPISLRVQGSGFRSQIPLILTVEYLGPEAL